MVRPHTTLLYGILSFQGRMGELLILYSVFESTANRSNPTPSLSEVNETLIPKLDNA